LSGIDDDASAIKTNSFFQLMYWTRSPAAAKGDLPRSPSLEGAEAANFFMMLSKDVKGILRQNYGNLSAW